MLQTAGWRVGKDRVQRIWRHEGLKMPKKHRPSRQAVAQRRRLPRLPLERTNHVWSFEFVESRTHDGRSLRIMTLIDEYTRECQAFRLHGGSPASTFIETLADAMLQTGGPEHIRCDNSPEMSAEALREWLAKLGTKPLYIEPGSPWANR